LERSHILHQKVKLKALAVLFEVGNMPVGETLADQLSV
jgi:hypothetical protein